MTVTATPGIKMVYLIKRRDNVSREELVMHWFGNHMPNVIARQARAVARGLPHPHRYVAHLFDANNGGVHVWDGMTQLWWDEPQQMPEEAYGITPPESFQQKAEPYVPWATREYIIVDGALPVEPLTFGQPFPTTRSGFYRTSVLIKARPGVNFKSFYDHWLNIHVPNVQETMMRVSGFRYVVNVSLAPENEAFAGLAELYFSDPDGWHRFNHCCQSDGFGALLDLEGTQTLSGRTEMIGIP